MLYPARLGHAIVQSFQRPWDWVEAAPGVFEHPQGLCFELEETQKKTLVILQFEQQIMEHESPLHDPVLNTESRQVAIGLLQMPSWNLDAFQNALYTQWGLKAQQRLQALSHLIAQKVGRDDTFWMNRPVEDSLNTHNLCAFSTQGQWIPPSSLPLRRLNSAHELLQRFEEMAWVQERFPI